MSLHDIFMQRAALEHQNMLNSDNAGIVLQSLAEGVAKGIAEEHQRMKAQRDAEEQQKKSMEQFNALEKSGYTIKRKITSSDGKLKVEAEAIDPTASNADLLKQKREERLATQYELNNATKLRTEFINRPEVKDFITVNTNVNAMQSLLDKAIATKDKQNYVAIDQGLITMYNKLTDPQSVVRESEYARTPENLPTVNRIVGAVEKLKAGGAGLTDDDRKALVEGAKIILKERSSPYNSALQEYTDLSLQYGLDPTMVNRGMKPYNPEGAVDSASNNYKSKYGLE